MKAKYINGPMKGKESEIQSIVNRIQIPFMTDKKRINSWGEVVPVYDFVTYELKAERNDKGEYVIVKDDGYYEWKKFHDNPELLGAKWMGE